MTGTATTRCALLDAHAEASARLREAVGTRETMEALEAARAARRALVDVLLDEARAGTPTLGGDRLGRLRQALEAEHGEEIRAAAVRLRRREAATWAALDVPALLRAKFALRPGLEAQVAAAVARLDATIEARALAERPRPAAWEVHHLRLVGRQILLLDVLATGAPEAALDTARRRLDLGPLLPAPVPEPTVGMEMSP